MLFIVGRWAITAILQTCRNLLLLKPNPHNFLTIYNPGHIIHISRISFSEYSECGLILALKYIEGRQASLTCTQYVDVGI